MLCTNHGEYEGWSTGMILAYGFKTCRYRALNLEIAYEGPPPGFKPGVETNFFAIFPPFSPPYLGEIITSTCYGLGTILNGGLGRTSLVSSSLIRSRIGEEDPPFFYHYLYIYPLF